MILKITLTFIFLNSLMGSQCSPYMKYLMKDSDILKEDLLIGKEFKAICP